MMRRFLKTVGGIFLIATSKLQPRDSKKNKIFLFSTGFCIILVVVIVVGVPHKSDVEETTAPKNTTEQRNSAIQEEDSKSEETTKGEV